MDELNKYQTSLLESIEQENSKYEFVNQNIDLDSMLSRGRLYQAKLNNMIKDMESLKDRSDRIKKRAAKLEHLKQQEALKLELERDRDLQRERQLKPVVVKDIQKGESMSSQKNNQ